MLYIKIRYSRKRKNIKSADKVFRKQTLESLDPLLQLNWRRAIFSNSDAKELIQKLKSISKILQSLHSSLGKTLNCEPATVNGY